MTRVNRSEDDGSPIDLDPAALSAHAERLRYRFEASGDGATLEQALRLGREAYARAGLGSAATVEGLAAFRLASTLSLAFGRIGDPALAQEALTLFDAADRLLPSGHPDLAAVSTNRAAVLLNLYIRSGDSAQLDAAIAEGRRSVTLSADDPHSAPRHSNLGGLLRTRFQLTGETADIDAAVEQGRLAVSRLDGQERQTAPFYAALAASLVLRFAATHADEDLAETIAVGRRALALAPEAGPLKLMALGVLAGALKADFERSGNVDRLGEAIDCLRKTTDLLTPGDADLPVNLANLADALLKRSERFGAREDIDEAVAAVQRGLDVGHAAAEPFMRRILGSALLRLGERLIVDGDADAAVKTCDEAVRAAIHSLETLPSVHVDRADGYTVLGNAWVTRSHASGDVADTGKAAAAYQAAIDATAPDDPRRPLLYTNLGVFNMKRDNGSPDTAQELAEATRALREAVRLSIPGHPAWAVANASLGVALLRSVRADSVSSGTRTASRSKLDEALALFAQFDDASAAPPRIRLAAKQTAAAVHEGDDDLPAACASYTEAVELLPQTAWHGLGQAVKEKELADHTGLGNDAAAAFLTAGEPERALELLEQGRGVLWSQRLARRLVDARLEAALPDHALRLRELTQALDAID